MSRLLHQGFEVNSTDPKYGQTPIVYSCNVGTEILYHISWSVVRVSTRSVVKEASLFLRQRETDVLNSLKCYLKYQALILL